MITTLNTDLTAWDHYTYRSLNAKRAFYTNTITRGYDAIYPPATTLLQYFFMKIIGIYDQGIEAFAIQLFGFSLLLPLFGLIKGKKGEIATVSTLILCIPAVFQHVLFYQSAYPDATLGLLLGYSLFFYFLCTKENATGKALGIGLALAMMTIIKPIGFVLAGITIGIFILYEGIKKRKTKEKINPSSKKVIGIIILIVLLTFCSYKFYTQYYEAYNRGPTKPDQSRTNGNGIEYILNSVAGTIFGRYDDTYKEGSISNGNLIQKLYNTKCLISPVMTSLASTIALFGLVSFILYRKYIRKEDQTSFGYAMIAIAIGLLFYVIALQCSYLTKFSLDEMLGHDGIDRYMPTFFIGILYFMVASVLHELKKRDYQAISYGILTMVIVAITPLYAITEATITSGTTKIQAVQEANLGRAPANYMLAHVEDNARIITINQVESTNLYNIMIRYYLYPTIEDVTIVNETKKEETVQKINTMLNETDKPGYIYLYKKDSNIEKWLRKYFKIEGELSEYTLYQVKGNQFIKI